MLLLFRCLWWQRKCFNSSFYGINRYALFYFGCVYFNRLKWISKWGLENFMPYLIKCAHVQVFDGAFKCFFWGFWWCLVFHLYWYHCIQSILTPTACIIFILLTWIKARLVVYSPTPMNAHAYTLFHIGYFWVRSCCTLNPERMGLFHRDLPRCFTLHSIVQNETTL